MWWQALSVLGRCGKQARYKTSLTERASGPVRHGNRLSYFRVSCAAMGVSAKCEGEGLSRQRKAYLQGPRVRRAWRSGQSDLCRGGSEEQPLELRLRRAETWWEGPGRAARLITQSIWDPMGYSPPGSSVQGIFQARILEWVVISYSKRSSRPRDQTHISYTGRHSLPLCQPGIPAANLGNFTLRITGNHLRVTPWSDQSCTWEQLLWLSRRPVRKLSQWPNNGGSEVAWIKVVGSGEK